MTEKKKLYVCNISYPHSNKHERTYSTENFAKVAKSGKDKNKRPSTATTIFPFVWINQEIN